MFKNNFLTKYQNYRKYFISWRKNLLPQNDTNVNIKQIQNHETHFKDSNGYLENLKEHFLHNNTLQNKNKCLYSIQHIVEQRKTTDNKKHNLKDSPNSIHRFSLNTLNKNFIFATSGLSAVSVATTEQTTNVIQNVEPAVTQSASLKEILDPIPEPPPVPDLPPAEEVLNQLNALGEPTFASLGLGGWSPIGLVQNCFEYLHVTLGVQWWAAVVIGTIVIRFAMFPLVIIAQRNAAKMNNYLPQMQSIQLKMTEARQTGNSLEAARYSQELMLFMNEKGLNPFKNMIVPLVQMPIFVSFFVGLRQMANVPVESMRTGGLWWFSDLTIPDQYFLMPLITSATLWLTIELGTDAAKLSAQNLTIMKYVLRALPVIILPFTVNFPGAILCYWVSSNFISLAQVGILRIPSVRDYFNIEPHLTHNPNNLPMKPKGFTQGVKDSWTNIKITKELEERRRLDALQFQRAGKGALVKTYKYDPTKQSSPTTAAPISAKKR